MVEEQAVGHRAVEGDPAGVEHHHALANPLDRGRVVRDEHERRAGRHLLGDPPQALALERLVAHGQDLVDQQHVGVEVRHDREPEPQVHPRAVGLDRHVDELAELRELDDALDPRLDLLAREPVQRAVQVDVLAAREVGAEAGAELEQRYDPPAAVGAPGVERHDPSEAAEQRRLARAVASHHPHRLARGDPQVDLAQRVHLRPRCPRPAHEQLLERAAALVRERERARRALEHDLAVRAHRITARSRSIRRNKTTPSTSAPIPAHTR